MPARMTIIFCVRSWLALPAIVVPATMTVPIAMICSMRIPPLASVYCRPWRKATPTPIAFCTTMT